MKTIIFKTLLLAVFVPAVAVGQNPIDSVLTLKQCIQRSFANNLKIGQAKLETFKTYEQLHEAIGAGLPQIGGVASFEKYFNIPVTMVSGDIIGQPGIMVPVKLGTVYNVNVGIQAGQMIYNASYITSVQLFRKSCEISDLSFQKNKEELAYNIALLYLFVQVSDSQLELLDTNYSALQKIRNHSGQLYYNGVIPKNELDRITVAMNNLSAERENLCLSRNQQLNMLKYLTGISMDQALTLSESLDDWGAFPLSVDTTFNNQIDIQLLEKQKDLAAINLKIARADRIPAISGYALYSFQSPVEQFNKLGESENWYKTFYAGLKLTVPIFEGSRLNSKTGIRKAELAQVTAGLTDLRNELNAKYVNAFEKYNSCKSIEAKQLFNTKMSQDILNATYQQYTQGLKSFTDILNAQSEYNVSVLSWLNSVLQIKISELELLKLNGSLHLLFL